MVCEDAVAEAGEAGEAAAGLMVGKEAAAGLGEAGEAAAGLMGAREAAACSVLMNFSLLRSAPGSSQRSLHFRLDLYEFEVV